MIVVADTTPLNYLVLIGESALLPTLYGGVVIPTAELHGIHGDNGKDLTVAFNY